MGCWLAMHNEIENICTWDRIHSGARRALTGAEGWIDGMKVEKRWSDRTTTYSACCLPLCWPDNFMGVRWLYLRTTRMPLHPSSSSFMGFWATDECGRLAGGGVRGRRMLWLCGLYSGCCVWWAMRWTWPDKEAAASTLIANILCTISRHSGLVTRMKVVLAFLAIIHYNVAGGWELIVCGETVAVVVVATTWTYCLWIEDSFMARSAAPFIGHQHRWEEELPYTTLGIAQKYYFTNGNNVVIIAWRKIGSLFDSPNGARGGVYQNKFILA